ncbi:hypothetical protein L1049_009399 [Liquidambar formosana]|uniref:Solute carrier family 40 member n=1 Tax=Liquidambar formosana TaxID=63359 RepID=A0AAP0SBB0_LIQFO
MSVYEGIPALKERNQRRTSRLSPSDPEKNPSTYQKTKGLLSSDESNSESSGKSWKDKIIERVSNISFVGAWKVYLRQDVVLPGVALALLYFTVLSFGTLMTAALEWEGIPAYCYWTSTRNKCYSWNSCNTSIPNHAVSYSNTPNRTLVYLVSGIYSSKLRKGSLWQLEDKCSVIVAS